MEITFWGVRGTAPVSGKEKNKYGGHTLCASVVTCGGEKIIVDAGTGVRQLGEKLIKEKGKAPLHLSLLLTHFHLDHIIGLPFFAPLYLEDVHMTFYAPALPDETKKYLTGLMARRYFPQDFLKTESKKTFKEVPEESFSLGPLLVSHCPLIHPQGSIAFKIQEKEKSIVFASDTEPPEQGMDEKLISFVRRASIFVYDAMYTPQEYESGKRGWGHSTWLEGTKIAKAAGVGSLYLSHFNPGHSDRQIDRMVMLARREFSKTHGARQGLKKTLI